MALVEQRYQFSYAGMGRQNTRLEYGGGTYGQKPNHGADLQTHGIAIREMEKIVEETVCRVPHLIVMHADAIHGIGDPSEMFEEAVGYLLVHGVVVSQNECNLQHVEAIESHPGSAVSLIQVPAT